MTAYLESLTPEAEVSVGGERIELTIFPYRVGRESRLVASADGMKLMERRKTSASPSNELYLIDEGRPLTVSRAHFQIERSAEGYVMRDRGSALGTYVGGTRIGGRDMGGACQLVSGDVIVAGTSESPFAFRFLELAE